MQPDIEREYLKLIEEVEAHFAAHVRWSEDSRFEDRWLRKLHEIRTRELTAMVQAAQA